MIMLITSSHETPHPSPYMGYVGMWVDLGDGPKESGYKSRRGGGGGGAAPRRESAVKRRRRMPAKKTDVSRASRNPRRQELRRNPDR